MHFSGKSRKKRGLRERKKRPEYSDIYNEINTIKNEIQNYKGIQFKEWNVGIGTINSLTAGSHAVNFTEQYSQVWIKSVDGTNSSSVIVALQAVTKTSCNVVFYNTRNTQASNIIVTLLLIK